MRRRRRLHPTIQTALIAGGALAGLNALNLLLQLIVWTVISDTQDSTALPSISAFAVCLTFIARLCAYYLAGMFAAERAGTVASAGAAGMLTAALDGASSVALTLLRIAVWPGLATSSQAVPPSGDALLSSAVLFACIGLAGGGVLGTLGWLDGHKRYEQLGRRQKDQTAEYIRSASSGEPY